MNKIKKIKKMQKQMSALENSGTEIREAKFEQDNWWSDETTTKKISKKRLFKPRQTL